MLDGTVDVQSPCVIHYVDVARLTDELRPVCGAWADEVTWTTVPAITTCPQCARVWRELASEPKRSIRARTPGTS